MDATAAADRTPRTRKPRLCHVSTGQNNKRRGERIAQQFPVLPLSADAKEGAKRDPRRVSSQGEGSTLLPYSRGRCVRLARGDSHGKSAAHHVRYNDGGWGATLGRAKIAGRSHLFSSSSFFSFHARLSSSTLSILGSSQSRTGDRGGPRAVTRSVGVGDWLPRRPVEGRRVRGRRRRAPILRVRPLGQRRLLAAYFPGRGFIQRVSTRRLVPVRRDVASSRREGAHLSWRTRGFKVSVSTSRARESGRKRGKRISAGSSELRRATGGRVLGASRPSTLCSETDASFHHSLSLSPSSPRCLTEQKKNYVDFVKRRKVFYRVEGRSYLSRRAFFCFALCWHEKRTKPKHWGFQTITPLFIVYKSIKRGVLILNYFK